MVLQYMRFLFTLRNFHFAQDSGMMNGMSPIMRMSARLHSLHSIGAPGITGTGMVRVMALVEITI